VNFRCNSMVSHGDGTLVTALSPAKSGEEVVIYGFGLGGTVPDVETGAATPATASTVAVRNFMVQFDFYPNAAPSVPYISPGTGRPTFIDPAFAGLTPGQVGLYQINVILRASPASLSPCSTYDGGNPSAVVNLLNVLGSNLTINIIGYSSFDGAAICMQPGQ
jgi:uncharacterized protein (TIGR03437 family)